MTSVDDKYNAGYLQHCGFNPLICINQHTNACSKIYRFHVYIIIILYIYMYISITNKSAAQFKAFSFQELTKQFVSWIYIYIYVSWWYAVIYDLVL